MPCRTMDNKWDAVSYTLTCSINIIGCHERTWSGNYSESVPTRGWQLAGAANCLKAVRQGPILMENTNTNKGRDPKHLCPVWGMTRVSHPAGWGKKKWLMWKLWSNHRALLLGQSPNTCLGSPQFKVSHERALFSITSIPWPWGLVSLCKSTSLFFFIQIRSKRGRM